jgi:negative regulator of flagellin synthesis FlgM
VRVNQNQNQINQAQTAEASATQEKKKLAKFQGASNDSASTSSVSADTKTEISSKAKDMARAQQVAKDAPDVRSQKIQELKNKIANKQYNVSAEQVADKLVDDHVTTPRM